ncbi:MAG: urate hydroxylase PuuD [Deltaproteobacteria bacterium]|nr:urate hydroxylase PuuD [Deltaproteobacteria bacterium]
MTVHEFLDMLFRWVHMIAGIMWIGNSLLFNWLDRNLIRPTGAEGREGFEGEIWLVHSGGFYQVEKKLLAPHQLPPVLHWFKWQNGFTWMSGICLLIIVYYMNEGALLVDSGVSNLTPRAAILVSAVLLVAAWFAYDFLFRFLESRPRTATSIAITALLVITIGLCHLFSGRAAYIHVGVLMGTLMTGNVWLRILPSQRQLIAATRAGQKQDPVLSKRAKQRSIHNNYMTFPLLFIMLSNHFPSTHGNELNWAILGVLTLAGAGVRHFMNIRFTYRRWLIPSLGLVVAATVALFVMTARPTVAGSDADAATVSFSKVSWVISQRCVPCHSAVPTDKAFPVAPSGVMFDSPDQVRRMAARIKDRALINRTMPLSNRTGMTEEERALLGRWVDQGARID